MKLLERISLWLAVVVIGALLLWLGTAGADRLNLEFLISSAGPSGLTGGIGPILANTFVIVSIALAIATPIAVAAALAGVFGTRSHIPLVAGISTIAIYVVELGLCLPRLLWGLAGAAIFGHFLGLGVSAAAGILTLAFLLVPMLGVGFRNGLARAAGRYGDTCKALGYSDMQMLMRVALPEALPAFLSSLLIAGGRAIGDAAALILTAGFGSRFLSHWFDSGSTLAVHIYVLAVEIGGGLPTAAAASFVLLIITMILHVPVVICSGTRPRSN